jgi:superfamily II DNA or RNA helicase
MPTTSHKRATSATPPKPPKLQGWNTTDADEIALRRHRAQTEEMTIAPSVPAPDGFHGDFDVTSGGSGRRYQVEIRALLAPENSCTCTDFRHSGLGTCKHIEATLERLRRGKKLAFLRAGEAGSPFAEVFLSRLQGAPRVRVSWPHGPSAHARKASAPQGGAGIPACPRPGTRVRQALAPFFDANGLLLADPVDAIPALQRAAAAAGAVARQIRISRDVLDWTASRRRERDREQARADFLQDVQAGKRTLDVLSTKLYPYQHDGMLHLAFGERVLLADEMGLGKTIQAIAACELLRQVRGVRRVLVVTPASLKSEWEEQIRRFCDLGLELVWGPRAARLRQYRTETFFHICNYEQVRDDVEEINALLAPEVVILDEAQRIKNWTTRTARQIKRLAAPYAFVLTGTPLENRIDEVYSIVEFLNRDLFGPLFRFNREFYDLDERGRPVGVCNLAELHRRLRPVMLRRRKSEVEDQLPERTVRNHFVPLDPEQRLRYEEYETRVAKLVAMAKRRPLTRDEWDKLQKWLACMRMLCDTPFILDPDCRICPKLTELRALLEPILAEGDSKIILFSEWERMQQLVRDEAETLGVGFAWHTGSVPQKQRRDEINRFKNDPDCRLFISTDAGATGLNLQCANVVINLDLPWNPARLEQRIARAWRKHQTRAVRVVNLVSENCIEHAMLDKLALKRRLADGVLDGAAGVDAIHTAGERRAMLERIASMVGGNEPSPKGMAMPPEKPRRPADPARAFCEDLMARHAGQVRMVARHASAGDGHPSVLVAVVRGLDEGARAGIVAQVAPDAAGAVEVLDEATYAAIRRLVAAGVLRFTGPAPEVLHREAGMADDAAAEQAKRRAAAAPLVDEADRRLRMARLLRANGFAAESLAPLKAACEALLKGGAILALGEAASDKPVSDAVVETALVPRGLVPAEALPVLLGLRADAPSSADDAIAACDAAVERLLAGLREAIRHD